MREYEKKVLKRASRESVSRLSRCPECFTPKLLKTLFKWGDGGTVTLRLLNPDMRFAFLENDLLNEIIKLLVGQFGEEQVSEIVRDTERASAAGYVSMLFGAFKPWMKPLTYIATHSFLLGYVLEKNVVLLGYGAGELVELKMPNAVVYTRNPYNVTLFSADLEACYLVAREREIRAIPDPVSEQEGIYFYHGRAEPERIPDAFKKYTVTMVPANPVDSPYDFPRCPRCGVPTPITQLWWDARDGMIVHKMTGRRMILWPCYALERLLEALEARLGREAEELIFSTVKEYQVRSIASGGVGFSPLEQLEFLEADKKGQYELLLKHLACRGFGHGVVELGDGRVRVKMTNALIPLVTSGLVSGMVEALEDRPVKVSREELGETTVYTLEVEW